MEKKQSKHGTGREKRPLGRKYLQLDLRLVGGGRASELAPGGARLFGGNHGWQSPRALRRHFVLQQEGLLGQAQQRCINEWTHRMCEGNLICFGGFFLVAPNRPTFYLSITKMSDMTHVSPPLIQLSLPLAASFLLTLFCSLERPHVRAPILQWHLLSLFSSKEDD